MKRQHTRPLRNMRRRVAVFIALVVATVICVVPSLRARASNPGSGSLSPGSTAQLTWDGTATGPASVDESTCEEGLNCDTYTLTLTGQPADWTGKRVSIQIQWISPATDYDLYVHKDSNEGREIDHSGGTATTSEQVQFDPSVEGTGVYTVHVVYFAASVADQYHGKAFVGAGEAEPPVGVRSSEPLPRYQNHTATARQLTTGKGTDAAEPTMGVNWKTNYAFYQSYLSTFRVQFNDSCPSSPGSTWVDKSSPVTAQRTLDPMLWVDNQTGASPNRIIVSQLSGKTSLSAYSDDDGETWLPSTGGGINSGVDHQSIGGGPYRTDMTALPPVVPPPHPLYPNAVYYCSQDVADALCARSDDGGQSYGPAIPIYTVNQCAGLHGQPKVSPDGVVYVPNSGCESDGLLSYTRQGVIVSEDNGITWSIRTVPGSQDGQSDPSVEIDKAGRVYLAYANDNRKLAVATSTDRGRTWQNVQDISTMVGVNNTAFPTMVSGDAGRAAVAFLGTPGTGNVNDLLFKGVWHLYISHTYDGGQTWTTADATPNDPIQLGALWLSGGSPIHRNLLDFIDATMDAKGRVHVAYADGCAGGPCVQAPAGADGNAYSQVAVIARQTGGKPLVAAFDPPVLTSVPGAPALSATRDAGRVKLSWSQSDDGGSPVTQYKVFRGTASGGASLLTTLPGTQKEFTDTVPNAGATYFYKVSAANAAGESCGTNEVAVPYVGSACAGLRLATDPTGDQKSAPANADLDVQWVNVSEPYMGAGVNRLVFKLKVASLAAPLLPNRQWRVLWYYPKGPGGASASDFVGRYYLGMNTDGSGAVSYEYGIVRNEDAVPASTQLPVPLGQPDAGTTYNADGTITFVIDPSKIGNPDPGDLLAFVTGRTFNGNGNQTLLSTSAIDTSVVYSVNQTTTPDTATAPTPLFGAYPVVGNNPACAASVCDLLNHALATVGGVASASTVYDSRNYSPAGAIDGDRTGAAWEQNGGWNDATRAVWPDTLEVDLGGVKTISEIRVYTLQDNFKAPQEPTPEMTATLYGIRDFDVQTWNGLAWVTVPGGAVNGNDRVMRTFTFAPVAASKVRVVVRAGRAHFSRIVELEALGCLAP